MRNLITSFLMLIGVVVAAPVHAIVPAGEMGTICTAGSPVCAAYALGAAERYWLPQVVSSQCKGDKTEKDIKAIDDYLSAVSGKDTIFTGKQADFPATFVLLGHLTEKKITTCAPGMKFSDLLEKCDSKAKKDQFLCTAYISGVLDMTLALNDLQQRKSGAGAPKALFCTSMEPLTPKMAMSEQEVTGAIAEWRKARPDRPKQTFAAQEIINALVMKYPCEKDNILKREKK